MGTKTPPAAASGQVRQVATATVVAIAGVGLTLGVLELAGGVPITSRGIAGAGSTLFLLCLVLWRTVTVARRTDGSQRLTLATVITITRGSALVAFAGVVTAGQSTERLQWLAAALFALAVALDAVDGAVARRTDSVTELGARLDTEVDALVVLVGTVAVVAAGTVPVAFLAVGLARYAFVAGSHVRRLRDRPLSELTQSRFRQLTGATIMGTVWVALLPTVGETVSRSLAWVVLVPILVHFLWDWLTVSGRVP